jgi:hypothetical protein
VTRPDLEKLLGGYAAGTLTAEERRALFEAALTDQALFDALADEEALREVLADPSCRERVRLALADQPAGIFEAFDVWLRRHRVWALAATAAAAAVVLTVVVARTRTVRPLAPAENQIAMAHKPALPSFNIPAQPPPSAPASQPRPQAIVTRAPTVTAQPAARQFMAPKTVLESPRPDSLAGRLTAPEVAASPVTAPPPPPPPQARESREAVTVTAESDAVRAEAAPAKALDSRGATGGAGAGTAGGAAIARRIAPKEAYEPAAPSLAAAPSVKQAAASLNRVDKADSGPAFGLRYTLIRRGFGNADMEVPADTPLSPGERAHLRIDAYQNGYLYIFSGERALFTGPALRGQPVSIEATPGTLHLILLPEPDSGPLSTLVSRTRRQLAGTSLRVEKKADARGDQSVSVVSPAPAAILTDISIASR